MVDRLAVGKQQMPSALAPAGANLGINDEAVAGQTLGHLHLHPRPRSPGDAVDPGGGGRRAIAEKADHWAGQA